MDRNKENEERLDGQLHTEAPARGEKLLEVKDLRVSFFTPAGEVKAVGGISYELNYGEVMGVVGESGSGKSQEAYSIIGLLQSPAKWWAAPFRLRDGTSSPSTRSK